MVESCVFNQSSWGSSYVDIDLSKGSQRLVVYRDPCKNKIHLKKGIYEVPSGYKSYTHSTEKGDFIAAIKYGNQNQLGLENLRNSYYTEATVYYWSHDDGEAMPLMVRLKKDDPFYDYYEKKDYFSSPATWKREIYFHNQVDPELRHISEKLKEVVVLKLDVVNGSYFANGDSRAPAINGDVKVSVTSYPHEDVYIKCTHKASGGISSLRFLATRLKNTTIIFRDYTTYTSQHSTAFVYYWNSDDTHTNPLILQLERKDGTRKYYKLSAGREKRWENDTSINKDNLKQKLDEQNCIRNRAHIINLSERDVTEYTCQSCGNIKINLMFEQQNDYVRSLHGTVGGSSISRVVEGNIIQAGLLFPRGIDSIDVYFYPLDDGTPMLIHYPHGGTHVWYQIESSSSNTWNLVSDRDKQPHSPVDNSGILTLLLESYSPCITVDIGNIDTQNPYYDPGCKEVTKEQIKVTKSTEKTNYIKYIHTLCRKCDFRLRGITYGGINLNGIIISGVFAEVSAYYSVKDIKHHKPLLVELQIKNGTSDRYDYWKRSFNNNGSVSWTKLERAREDFSRPLKDLYEILDGLKAIHISNVPNLLDNDDKDSTSDQQLGTYLSRPRERETYQPPSKESPDSSGAVTGGILCGLACLCLLGIAMWKVGPSVRTYLASRQPLL